MTTTEETAIKTMTATELVETRYADVRAELEAAEKENEGIVFDVEDPKGEKAARSHIAGIRKVKANIERRRKDLKADALDYGRKVDEAAKELTERVEAMIEVHYLPIKAKEDKEKQRQEALELKLAELANKVRAGMTSDSPEVIDTAIVALEAEDCSEDAYAERADEAAEARDTGLGLLRDRLAKVKDQIAKDEELAKLRAEAAEREAEDARRRQEEERQRIQQEAKEKAEKEAKERAEREAAERAEADRRRDERITKAIEAIKGIAIVSASEIATPAQVKAIIARAESLPMDATAYGTRVGEAAAVRDSVVAALRETLRDVETLEAEKKKKALEADTQHRRDIEAVAQAAIEELLDTMIDNDHGQAGAASMAERIIEEIAGGEIPHVAIQY